jgi:hypothetical protein
MVCVAVVSSLLGFWKLFPEAEKEVQRKAFCP